MTTLLTAPPAAGPALAPARTVADALAALGDVPADRVLMTPPPGTATEADMIVHSETVRPCELVDGTLVEKPMGFPESTAALELAFLIRLYLRDNPVGLLGGEAAMIRLAPDLVRLPDLCFIPWSRVRNPADLRRPVCPVVPALAVEVPSLSNTRAEMDRKLGEYFAAGVDLVWLVDPAAETAEAYTSPTAVTPVPAGGALDGGAVLPGLSVPLAAMFPRPPAGA